MGRGPPDRSVASVSSSDAHNLATPGEASLADVPTIDNQTIPGGRILQSRSNKSRIPALKRPMAFNKCVKPVRPSAIAEQFSS